MGTAALIATALTRYGIPGAIQPPLQMLVALAAGTAILLIPSAIVVIPWRQVQATRRNVTNTPLYAGTALFAFLVLVALVGAATGTMV